MQTNESERRKQKKAPEEEKEEEEEVVLVMMEEEVQLSPVLQVAELQPFGLALRQRHGHGFAGLQRVDEQLGHDSHAHGLLRLLPQVLVSEADETQSRRRRAGAQEKGRRRKRKSPGRLHAGRVATPKASELGTAT